MDTLNSLVDIANGWFYGCILIALLAAGVLYPHGDLWNMVYASHSNVTARPPEKALPLLQIPTLPATGSEMNMCAVVSSTARRQKSYIWADCLYAKTAILDPELTYSLPPFQTADGVLASNPPVTAEMLAEILEGAV